MVRDQQRARDLSHRRDRLQRLTNEAVENLVAGTFPYDENEDLRYVGYFNDNDPVMLTWVVREALDPTGYARFSAICSWVGLRWPFGDENNSLMRSAVSGGLTSAKISFGLLSRPYGKTWTLTTAGSNLLNEIDKRVKEGR